MADSSSTTSRIKLPGWPQDSKHRLIAWLGLMVCTAVTVIVCLGPGNFINVWTKAEPTLTKLSTSIDKHAERMGELEESVDSTRRTLKAYEEMLAGNAPGGEGE